MPKDSSTTKWFKVYNQSSHSLGISGTNKSVLAHTCRFSKIAAFTSLALLALFLALSVLSGSSLAIYYVLLTFGGIALLLLGKKGLYWAYGLLALVMFLFFPSLWKKEALHEWSLFYSLALQFYTISLVLEELKVFFTAPSPVPAALEEEKLTLEQEIEKLKEEAELRKVERIHALQNLEKQLFEERQAAQTAYEALLAQKTALEGQLAQAQTHKEEGVHASRNLEKQLLEERQVAQTAYEALLAQKTALEGQLAQAQTHKEEGVHALQNLEKQLLEERQVAQTAYEALLAQKTALEGQLAEAQTKQTEDKTATAQFVQLRQQFEEKSLTLAKTRQELFQMESKWLAQEKEREYNASELSCEEKLLLQELELLFVENQLLLEEITALEQLVKDMHQR